MSRIPKLKIEKTKVKVVFRLQFHATHIPQPGWDKLFVTFTPTDSGKVTAKTTKASVRNGSCKWSDPIYETTRLLQDPKTKDYDEKLYKLVVAMGSSRSNLLGEVIINLADFVDALKPSSVALPLHGCDFGTILHLTVQLLTSKTGFREFEQQRELSVQGFQASSNKRLHDPNEFMPAPSRTSEHIDKVNARIGFKGDSTELPSLEEVGELDEEYQDSAAGVDCSSYTSESLYAEKNDFSGLTEFDKSRALGDVVGFGPVHSLSTGQREHNYRQLSSQLSNDWNHGWSSDFSIDNDLAFTCEDSDRLNARVQVAETAVLQLKSEVKSLQNLCEELSSEAQHLAQQLALELSSGEKLAGEFNILKSEYWKFKNDLDELKAASASLHTSRQKIPAVQMKCFPVEASVENTHADSTVDAEYSNLPFDFQSKLLQEIFLIECKALQIQNKACFGYNCNESDYIYSEFKALASLIQNLKQTIAQELSVEPVSGIQTTNNQYTSTSLTEQHFQRQNAISCFADLHYSEGIKEKKAFELSEQLEVSKNENGSLASRMTQMECYYEAFIRELDDRQKQTSDQLENLRAEHSSYFYTISNLQNQIEKLHEELNGQLIRFTEDRRNLESFIIELEKRASYSETMLKRVRWNHAIAVDRLQKDLELLSFQVLSMYEANQSLAKQALADASEYHDEHSEDMQLWHRGEWLVSSNQKQQKLALAEIQHDISWTNCDQELSTILNGVSDKLNHRMLYNLSSKEGNKGISQTGLSMDTEFHVNEEPNASANALKLDDIPSDASIHDFMKERKDSSLFHNSLFEKLRSNCLNNLNIQNHIDYSQISGNTEKMKDVYYHPRAESQLIDYRVDSKEIEMSLDVLKQLHATSRAELSEVVLLYMHWEVYARVLQETLREICHGIGHINGKVVEYQEKVKHCTNDKEFLFLETHAAMDESRILREAEAKFITQCNELSFKNYTMEAKLNDALGINSFLVQKVADYQCLIADSGACESKYKACVAENVEIKNLLKEEKSQSDYLQIKLSSLTDEFKSLKEEYEEKCSLYYDLQSGATCLQDKFGHLCNFVISCCQQISDFFFDDVFVEELDTENCDAIISHLEQFRQKASCRLFSLQHEKKVAEEQREIALCTLNERELNILHLKQKFDSELEEFRTKLTHSSTKVRDLELELQEALEKLKLSKEAEEQHIMENKKLLSNMSFLEAELLQATNECRNFSQKLLATEDVLNEELANTKLRLEDLIQENRDLLFSIQSYNAASVKLECELSDLRDSLNHTHDELQSERKTREDLEVSIADLKLEVVEKSQQLLFFKEQKDELCYLRTRVLDLEREVQRYVMFCKERERKIASETSSLNLEVAYLENHLVAAIGHSISADVELTFMRDQLNSKIADFAEHQKTSKRILEELHLKHFDVIVSVEKYIASEAEFLAERESLSTDLLAVKSTLEVLSDEKESLLAYIDANTISRVEFEDLRTIAAISEASYTKEKLQNANEICLLKSMLLSLEELNELYSSKVELDIMVVFLRSKLSEQETHIALFATYDYELRTLREQHIELNRKFSEQILKTEEFKNLSIHLKELKDKADVECHQARERRESEGSSLAGLESLRIAFIKEQYESKIHELKNQCTVARKYAEEILIKLQNSLDDNETRKKSEACLAKRNEEMSVLLSDLETELQTVVADRRELIKAYDGMKTELECTILRLECCQEEKLKLRTSLKESNDEREKIRVELDLVKRVLENMTSTLGTGLEINYDANKPDATLIGELLEDSRLGISAMHDETSSAFGIICSEDQVAKVGRNLASETLESSPFWEINDVTLTGINKDSYMSIGKLENLLKEPAAERAILSENNATQIADIKEHFGEQQKLMTGMELLHKQLQRLRNENLSSELLLEEDHFDADLKDLHRELSQIEMANEQLGSIFPTYTRLTSYGNAIERLLALELELAEALQVKKSGSHTQSSFLKQHNDDEAVFQSFKDINELIKNMIELKKRNAAVEAELQDMHSRYSQLSLQFAEVEGERQRLVMSSKNRTPKKS